MSTIRNIVLVFALLTIVNYSEAAYACQSGYSWCQVLGMCIKDMCCNCVLYGDCLNWAGCEVYQNYLKREELGYDPAGISEFLHPMTKFG